MRIISGLAMSLVFGNVAAAQAQEQDVVVMRRAITPPVAAPSSSPTPSPTPAASGQWMEVSRSVAPACSSSAPVVVSYACFLPNGGGQTTDDRCAEPRPTSTETEANFAACSYSWSQYQYSNWSTTCGKATRSRSIQCVRDLTDQADESVSDDFCADSSTAGPRPSEQEGPVSVTSGCSALLLNADLNAGATGWTGSWSSSSNPDHNRSGSGAYLANTPTTAGSVIQVIQTVPGWSYRLTYWSRMWSENNTALGSSSMSVKALPNGTGNLTGQLPISTSPTWTKNTMVWTAISNEVRIVIGFTSYNTNDRMAIDDFELEVTNSPL